MSTTSTQPAGVSTWNLDPVHSVVEFKVKHMMISNVKGQFTGITGVSTLDEMRLRNLESKQQSMRLQSILGTRDAIHI